MEESKRFILQKKPMKKAITVEEFETLKGLSVSPKKDFKFDGMINVSKVTIDNPDLIKTYINKKCNRNMDKILKILKLLFDDESGDPSPAMLALNEIEKFRQLIINKYQKYMSKKEYNILIKKLEILELEVTERLKYIYTLTLEEQKNKKGR